LDLSLIKTKNKGSTP
jgi:hypothetical protein